MRSLGGEFEIVDAMGSKCVSELWFCYFFFSILVSILC